LRDVFFEKVSKILNIYTVQFKGLTVGKHIFNFDVDDGLFNYFESTEVFGGDLSVELVLDKLSNMLELDFYIEGEVKVQCDRCLELFTIPTEFEGKLVVQISDSNEENEQNDEIWYVNSNEHELSLAQYIFESICLSLPIQRFHGILDTSEEDCDKEMLTQLQKLSSQVEENEGNSDSRWDKLKDLLKN
jgi:uncharacterized protein